MGPLDCAFLNDPIAIAKVQNTLPLEIVRGEDYEAVFFLGGKGTMWGFRDNPHIHKLVRDYAAGEKLIGAVCHGPAALANVVLPDGTPILPGKPVTGFTNEEELFLIPKTTSIFPFLLEDRLRKQGAKVALGLPYLENVAVTDGLVTGQNPWSVYVTAETMVAQLGFSAVPRLTKGDENRVDVLMRYHLRGKAGGRESVDAFANAGASINWNLLVMHGLIAAMQWQVKSALELLVVAQHAKTVYS
jgi:putative intracellular protease/amidase